MVGVETERVQMLSICLAAPLAPVTSAVPGWTRSRLAPASANVVVSLYTGVTAVKTPPKTNKEP